jgi:rhodanese-related sulfurtransferase
MFMAGQAREVDVRKAKELMDSGDATMIDIRETQEWDQERLPGVTLLPMSTFTPRQIAGAADRNLLILCRSGRRAQMLAQALIAQGHHRNPLVVAGGILAWRAAGYPVEQGAPSGARFSIIQGGRTD